MVEINIQTLSIVVAVIAGVIGVLRIGGLPKKYSPITALVLGIGYSIVVPQVAIITGIIAGLTASGSWKLGQKVIGGVKVVKTKIRK